MKNFIVHFYVTDAFQYLFFQFFVFFLTGAVLKPPSSNIAQKFWHILLDLCEFFQFLESGDLYLFFFF